MTTIHSFLQKRKLHEFTYGVYLVIAAYALSFLLLIVGSDSLYNINSKAEGFNKQPNEANKIFVTKEDEDIIDLYDTPNTDQIDYEADYRYDYLLDHIDKYAQSITDDNTNLLMGFLMTSEEYSNMLSYMNGYPVNEDEESLSSLTKIESDSGDNTIASFSIDSKTAKSIAVSASAKDGEMVSNTELATDDLVTEDLPIEETKGSVRLVASKEEIKMLERIVEAEATGEGMKGKILVANVVINRIEDEDFPDTVEGVIFHKVGGEYQFSPISDKRYWKVKVTDETKEAVQRALDGEDYSEGALYFMARRIARKSSARWFDNNLKWLFKHGGHEFYK